MHADSCSFALMLLVTSAPRQIQQTYQCLVGGEPSPELQPELDVLESLVCEDVQPVHKILGFGPSSSIEEDIDFTREARLAEGHLDCAPWPDTFTVETRRSGERRKRATVHQACSSASMHVTPNTVKAMPGKC